MTEKELLRIATAEIGTKENPAGSNKVKCNTWYYGREVSGKAYPWCMVFVQWVFDRAGIGRADQNSVLRRAAQCSQKQRTGC